MDRNITADSLLPVDMADSQGNLPQKKGEYKDPKDLMAEFKKYLEANKQKRQQFKEAYDRANAPTEKSWGEKYLPLIMAGGGLLGSLALKGKGRAAAMGLTEGASKMPAAIDEKHQTNAADRYDRYIDYIDATDDLDGNEWEKYRVLEGTMYDRGIDERDQQRKDQELDWEMNAPGNAPTLNEMKAQHYRDNPQEFESLMRQERRGTGGSTSSMYTKPSPHPPNLLQELSETYADRVSGYNKAKKEFYNIPGHTQYPLMGSDKGEPYYDVDAKPVPAVPFTAMQKPNRRDIYEKEIAPQIPSLRQLYPRSFGQNAEDSIGTLAFGNQYNPDVQGMEQQQMQVGQLTEAEEIRGLKMYPDDWNTLSVEHKRALLYNIPR